MSRPIKQGLDYFSHDTDASSDEKIGRIKAEFGNDGYAFYFITLERIYRTGDGKLYLGSEVDKKILAAKIGITLRKFEKILEKSLKNNLFDEKQFLEKKYLTSPGIEKRFLQIQSERKRKREFYNKSKEVLDVQKGGRNPSNTPGETTGETPQSKVKESRVIELAKSLIESIKKESSFYAIINKYISALGENKVLDILTDCQRMENIFANENKLAAYLEACARNNGQITNHIPEIKEGTPGWM